MHPNSCLGALYQIMVRKPVRRYANKYLHIATCEFSLLIRFYFALQGGSNQFRGFKLHFSGCPLFQGIKKEGFRQITKSAGSLFSSVFHIFSWNRLYQNAVLHIFITTHQLYVRMSVNKTFRYHFLCSQ